MAEFLDIERDYWVGISYMAIEVAVAQLFAIIFLKLLVTKFQ